MRKAISAHEEAEATLADLALGGDATYTSMIERVRENVRELRAEAPEAENVIARCLRRQREDRFASMTELASALRCALG